MSSNCGSDEIMDTTTTTTTTTAAANSVANSVANNRLAASLRQTSTSASVATTHKQCFSFGPNSGRTVSPSLPATAVAAAVIDERLSAPITWRTTTSPIGIGMQSMDTTSNQSLTQSLINFQMPQNFILPQMLPNFPNYLPSIPSMPSMPTMPSLQDYLTQLPTLPTVSMPSIPNLSMPNISIPSMPNLPSIPSFSDFMNSFPSRRPIKPWPQLRQAVKNSHRRFSEIGCKVPFLFNWREDKANKRLRIYFLSSINISSEISLIYCDIDTDPDSKPTPDVHQIGNNIHNNVINERVAEEVTSGSDEEFIPMTGRRIDKEFNLEANRKPEASNGRPQWKPLIINCKSNLSFDFEPKSSREENLQLERKRIMFSGITSYEYQQKSSRFVFTAGDTLYWFDDPLATSDQKSISPPYLPQKLESTTSFTKMNPQLCPSDPNLVAYVADGDLWVCNLKSGLEFRLTETKFDADSGVVSAGLPSYVLQEEFRRYTGFWWRPDNEYDHIDGTDGDLSYSILCEFVDESDVDVVKIASWDGTVEEYRFPRPGQSNAESSLSIVTFSLSPLTQLISDVKISSLPKSLNDIFPAYEYLVRCGWHSHDVIWVQLLNRSQSHLVLVLMSVYDLFPPQIIYEEQSSKWINCHDVLHFFSSTDGNDLTVGSNLKFIWSSEETGFRHLFKIEIQLVGTEVCVNTELESRHSLEDREEAIDAKLPKLDSKLESNSSDSQRSKSGSSADDLNSAGAERTSSSNVSPSSDCYINSNQFNSIQTLRSTLVSKSQLTHGNWEVSDKEVWIDEHNSYIYFTGLKESPLERHLYVISLNYPKLSPKRLTVEDFSHTTIAFNTNYSYFIDIQSNITIPPFGYLQKVVASNASLPDAELLRLFLGSSADPGEDSEQLDLLPGMAAPQLFDYRLKSGDLIYGFIFKPECMEAGVRYPVLLEIYGGPEVQLVSKSFKAVRHCRRHLLASEGYIVVAFDSRGSKHRGVSFESHCSRRLGQVEIADQVEALQWLAANTDFIDMSRIAVHGWSYGGYLSLMALAQRPDIFKCAIAGAPVTNWQLYDTGYTERYMDTPANNPEGYRLGNVITHINSFPNEENRLLIIHGLMDENVHFAHTVQLIQALVKAGKPYLLNVYPFERHSLRHSQCSEHYETLLLSFLQNNL